MGDGKYDKGFLTETQIPGVQEGKRYQSTSGSDFYLYGHGHSPGETTRDGVAIILSEKMRKHQEQAGRSPAFDMCSQRITTVDLLFGTGVQE